jgi:catechol 2,3-dioxygenase-like lactoylglutathione lyase family enzyme
MSRDDLPEPQTGFVVTHFLVVSDQDRSRDYYQSVFGAEVAKERDPVILKLANSWLILNVGGGPTDDKPTVTLNHPAGSRSDERVYQPQGGRHRCGLRAVVGARRSVPHRAHAASHRNPRVHPGP